MLKCLVYLILFLVSKLVFAESCVVTSPILTTSSESGKYTLVRLMENGSTKYELLEEGEPALKFKHDFVRLRFQALLNDGTFVGVEGGGCYGSAVPSRIHIIDVLGKLAFSATVKDLVKKSYLEQAKRSKYDVGAQIPWLYGVTMNGDSQSNAIVAIRLANYDKVEIEVDGGKSTYIPIPDLADDATGWSRRASWYGFIGEREKEFEHYSRALELAPEDSSVRSYLVRHYSYKKQYEKARNLIEDALVLEPLAESDVVELDSFNQRTNYQGHSLSYQFQLAELYKKEGKPLKAVKLMDEVLALNPKEWRCNLLKAELQITEKNREQIRQNINSVFDFHIAYVEHSDENQTEKDVVIENYRESYAAWLSEQEFHSEADQLLRIVSDKMDPDSGYYGYSREQNFKNLAENAKRRGDVVAELNYLIQAADYTGSHYSLEEIAWRFIRGEGAEKNYVKALEWFQKAVEFSYSRADYFPICYLKYSVEAKKNWKKAKPWCEKGVDENQGDSAFWLALMRLNEKKFKRKRVAPNDIAEFDKLLLQARDRGYPGYGQSDEVDWDIYELSDDVAPYIPALVAIAEQGSFITAFHLGELYQYGVGVKEDKKQASIWFEKASASGDPQAQYQYGKSLLYTDTEKAIELFETSANAGQPWSAMELGELYFKGIWVERDLKKMEYWLLFADKTMKQQDPSRYSGSDRETWGMKQLLEYRSSM